MSLEERWHDAVRETEIVQVPMKRLVTFGSSSFEYIMLSPSEVNVGDTVVRKGRMDIDQPKLLLPNSLPQFEGFESDSSELKDEELASFFYVRGISFPSLKYHNEPYTLDLFEGSLAQAEKQYLAEVRTREDVATGIVIGKDHSWQFSVILLACHMIDSVASSDMRAILERIKKKGQH